MLIFVPCSSRKRVDIPVALRADRIRAHTLDKYADTWVERVRQANSLHKPLDVYAGQGVQSAIRATEQLEGKLHFVSAGMSVVGQNSRIPGYDLTIGKDGPNPFFQIGKPINPSDWWISLNRAFGLKSPLASLIRCHDQLALIALPRTYLRMVTDELEQMEPAHLSRVRLIVSKNLVLNPGLSDIAIRYDRRFRALESASHGPDATFAQRALLHFAGLLADNPRIKSVASQQAMVDKALSTVENLPAVPVRTPATDAEIRGHIRATLSGGLLSKTAVLKHLRRDLEIACEQRRFYALYEDIAAK